MGTEAAEIPLFCNFAIVQPVGIGDATVQPNQSTLWNEGYPTGVKKDFFRYNGGPSRSYDFDANPSTIPECFDGKDYGKAPINTDEFAVLWHWRCTLGTIAGSQYKTDQPRYRNKVKYIPIKRQIRFETTTDNSTCSSRLYFLYWFSGMDLKKGVFGGTNKNPADAKDIEAAAMRHKLTVYFRESNQFTNRMDI